MRRSSRICNQFDLATISHPMLTLFERIWRCADGDCVQREEVGSRWEDRMSEVFFSGEEVQLECECECDNPEQRTRSRSRSRWEG